MSGSAKQEPSPRGTHASWVICNCVLRAPLTRASGALCFLLTKDLHGSRHVADLPPASRSRHRGESGVMRQVGSRGQPPGMATEAANAAIRYAFRAQQDHNLHADPAAVCALAMFPDLDRWCSTSEGRGRPSSSSKVLHLPGALTLAPSQQRMTDHACSTSWSNRSSSR
jgi:hypothetical protein